MAPSAHEKKLLDASKAFDEAISKKDASQLPQLLAKDVVLHHDGITRGQDVTGADAVARYIQDYPTKYHYASHKVIAGAVDEKDNVAFSFWLDTSVKPVDGAETAKSTDTVGIWHHVFNSDNKISHIWFLRQLSHDELESKMKEAPLQKTQFDPSKYRGSDVGQSEEHSPAYEKAARAFHNIWASGNASAAKDIMADDVSIYDPVMGSETHGCENFEKMIDGFSKSWTCRENKSHFAVTAGDKAFIFWLNTGASKDGPEESLYGLNMLTFNSDGKISNVIGFRQLLKSETESKVKGPVQKA